MYYSYQLQPLVSTRSKKPLTSSVLSVWTMPPRFPRLNFGHNLRRPHLQSRIQALYHSRARILSPGVALVASKIIIPIGTIAFATWYIRKQLARFRQFRNDKMAQVQDFAKEKSAQIRQMKNDKVEQLRAKREEFTSAFSRVRRTKDKDTYTEKPSQKTTSRVAGELDGSGAPKPSSSVAVTESPPV